MRTPRASVAITIAAFGLLAGTAVGVGAQDQAALQLVTEEVEPGVERVISDGAGHDLDETHPTYRYDMDSIVLAADGTIWLTTTYHQTDSLANPEEPLVWALGQPGVHAEDGVLVPLGDGSLLAIDDDVVRFDGEAFVPDDGPMYRPLPGPWCNLWLIEPDDLMGLVPEGESAVRPTSVLPAIWNGGAWLSPTDFAWPSLTDFARVCTDRRDTWCETDGMGITCEDPRGKVTTYLASTAINQLVMTPDGSVWAVGQYDGGPGGLYRITLPEPDAD